MAVFYEFPAGAPANDALRRRANEEGVSFDPQQIVVLSTQWKGYSGIAPSDLTQTEKDQIMSALVDMTGQNVSGPYTRSEVQTRLS